jgi:hypothetical protein
MEETEDTDQRYEGREKGEQEQKWPALQSGKEQKPKGYLNDSSYTTLQR